MDSMKSVLVFSDNRETKSIYQSYANSINATIYFKEKNKNSLVVLMEQVYDLYIIEIMQPVMAEIEFVDQVHSLVNGRPIIVISSFFYDTKDIVFGDKISGFLLKPFDLDKLTAVASGAESVPETASAPVEKPVQAAVSPKVDQVLYESKKLSVLLEISRSLNSITDFDELLHRIIVLAAETLNAERATLFILDKKKKQLWSRTGIGIEKQEIRIPMTSGIAGEVALSGVAQIIDDPYKHPKFNKEVDLKTGFKTRNILCLPMKNITGEVLGVFQILNKIGGEFTKEDQLFLNGLAANTGIAIENALLHVQMKHQIEEIKQSYDDLYIAQNQILKEGRFATFSEVGGFIQSVLSEAAPVSQTLSELKRMYGFDVQIKQAVDKVQKSFDDMVGKMNTFLEAKKAELFK